MAQSRAQASLVASAPEPRPRPQLRRCNFAGVSCLRASRQVVVAVEYEQIAAAPWRCSGCPGGSSSRCQPVWLTGGEFVDQRAQLAPGHASKVRVDRLQGRRPLVTQRARNQ
jgi:hypothetical protein